MTKGAIVVTVKHSTPDIAITSRPIPFVNFLRNQRNDIWPGTLVIISLFEIYR